MKKQLYKLAFTMILFLVICLNIPIAHATEITDEKVLNVISQLESIDTLQQMQDKRNDYAVNSRYNVYTTDTAIITAHESARTEYETYIAKMFAARVATQHAYNTLTNEQKALIDPALTAKLNNQLSTIFKAGTYSITPRNDEYAYEAVAGSAGTGGMAYEVSNHVTAGPEIPSTYILVDVSNGENTWTPSGKYVCGESNYEVTYCCDVTTSLKYGAHYKRVNLEDSNYYGVTAAQHIRAILQNAYPFITMDEMKSNLKADGLDAEFVEQLTRSDIIAAVQMAIWAYANAAEEDIANNFVYGSTYDVTNNKTIYMNPLHDYTNECWDWWTTAPKMTSYDSRAEYRVNTLVYYLCNLEGVAPDDNQIVISDIKVTRADLLPHTENTYCVGMYVYLNNGGSEQDNLKVTVSSYHTKEDGTVGLTAQSSQSVNGSSKLEMFVEAHSGDTIKVIVEGTQKLAKGVYFYEPENGRTASQCLVGVAEGETNIYAEETFEFVESIGEMGLRIYKTEVDTGSPLSDITFNIYKAIPGEGETLNATPTTEELAKYKTEANKVGSITTDITGYASITLSEGTYLITEEHNVEKIKAPVNPFYITLPISETKEQEDGTTSVETVKILSVYPKNEPVIPPEEPPVIPPFPDNVTGKFELLKYDKLDKSVLLRGAQFEVYRAATTADTATSTIFCDGIQYAVVPVMIQDERLILTTDDNGKAISPDLPCDTYFLVETKAPNGYYLLDEAISVTVVSSVMNTITTVEIANQRGNILPETGGIGTTWFSIIGSIFTITAIVLLIFKKRIKSLHME